MEKKSEKKRETKVEKQLKKKKQEKQKEEKQEENKEKRKKRKPNRKKGLKNCGQKVPSAKATQTDLCRHFLTSESSHKAGTKAPSSIWQPRPA